MDSLVDVNNNKLCITDCSLYNFHTTFPTPHLSMSIFVSSIFTFFTVFFKSFPCFLLMSKLLTFSPTPHTYGQFGALSQAAPPPQTICLICFVFSNELDVKFNTHTHTKQKMRWTFPFWIFRLAIEKAAKKSKSVTKDFFHDNRERRWRRSSSSMKRSKKHPQITHKHKHKTLALIFVYCRK